MVCEMKNTERKCKCHVVSMLADDSNIPIRYDPELNEYYLAYGNEGRVFFYYCPMCGGRLPKSKRGQLFTRPSVKEKSKITEKIKEAKSIGDIVAILGEPDERHEQILHSTEQKIMYRMKDVRQTLRYTSLAKTFNLLLQEYEDGSFAVLFEGKVKLDAANKIEKEQKLRES